MTDSSSESTPRKKSTSASAKKAPGKKAPAKRTSAKKVAPAKATASKTRARAASRPAREAAASEDTRQESGQRRGGTGIARTAREVVRDLTGKTPEAVTGIERTDDGWRIEVEVLELERIPSTTDVLATYAVDLGGDEEVQGYRRVRRYLRGTPGGEQS